uniref:Keratin, type II cuticular Hb3-like n=1 Tax=Nicotiana tabacum TaxID=4097 RepID=A0A1S3YHC0_TOBAC|nr:PREDICTED: keratin, type II cuticular Hb3-like [Nicotiana tabacum]
MAEKYQWYRNRCREIREQLRAGASTQSARDELEKTDEDLIRSICRVNALSAEWAEKVAKLEKKVAELEKAEDARVSAVARAASLEDTIRVLRSEQESERAMTTIREARLEKRTVEIDQEASNLGDRVATLEAKKTQLLAQVESVSTTVPRRLYDLWASLARKCVGYVIIAKVAQASLSRNCENFDPKCDPPACGQSSQIRHVDRNSQLANASPFFANANIA